jgi:hypothetical protein
VAAVIECAPWPLTPDCLPDGWDPDNLTDRQREAVARASSWLRMASGGVWGPCTVSRRFCPPEGGGRCGPVGPCGCGVQCTLELAFPASGPVTVTVNGAVDRFPWAIIEYTTLERRDGRCWPACAEVMVTYTQGWPVFASDPASIAMTRLAVWIADNPCPVAECGAPPPDWEQLNRDGWQVRRDATSPFDITGIFGGLTGLGPVDAWIRAVRRLPGIVAYSPDADQPGGVAVTDSGR